MPRKRNCQLRKLDQIILTGLMPTRKTCKLSPFIMLEAIAKQLDQYIYIFIANVYKNSDVQITF